MILFGFVNGAECRLRFQHFELDTRKVTTCEAFIGPRVQQVAKGAAICAPDDQFRPELGERKALARALKGTSRGLREQVWAIYEFGTPRELTPAGYGAGV